MEVSQVEENSHKLQILEDKDNKDEQRKRRRKKVDEDGRDYTCLCGKSYLSYPALYTHVKTKHNGELSSIAESKKPNIEINTQQCPPNGQNIIPIVSAQPNSCQKSGKPQTQPPEIENLQTLKQFIYKKIIKVKNVEQLQSLKSQLVLKDDEIKYTNQIVKQAERNQNYLSSPKGIAQDEYHKQLNATKKENYFQGNSNEKQNEENHLKERCQFFLPRNQSNFSIVRDELKYNQLVYPSQNCVKEGTRAEKKGFSSYATLARQNYANKNDKRKDNLTIDQMFGIFLSEVLRTSSKNDIVNLLIIFLVCRLKEFFNLNHNNNFTQQKSVEWLIQQANRIVQFFVKMENTCLKQPVSICTILFHFYRWMFKAKFTNKLIKFNVIGKFQI